MRKERKIKKRSEEDLIQWWRLVVHGIPLGYHRQGSWPDPSAASREKTPTFCLSVGVG